MCSLTDYTVATEEEIRKACECAVKEIEDYYPYNVNDLYPAALELCGLRKMADVEDPL